MRLKRALYMSPGDGGGGGISVVEEDFDTAVKSQAGVDPGVRQGFNEIPVDDDVEYVVEGSQPAPSADEPEFAREKSREELIAIVKKNQEDLEAERLRANSGATAIADALKGVIPQAAPQTPVEGFRLAMPQQGQPGATMGKTPAELKAELESRFISNPLDVLEEVTNSKMAPLVKTFAENQGRLARRLALTDVNNKKVYDKYAAEVEQIVAQTPVADKINDTDIYYKAIASVRAAHYTEFSQEEIQSQVQALLAEELKKLGIDPSKGIQGGGKPPVTLARSQSTASPAPVRRQVAIPKEVMDEANRTGKDPGMLFQLYKDRGYYK